MLARAEAAEPDDPRVPFRVGELLAAQGRHAEAIEAYRRTVRLDPTRALVFFKLGRSYREIGERHRAVYAFEQASLRAGAGNVLQRRADWEVEKLTFTIVPESGVSRRRPARGATRARSRAASPIVPGRHAPDRLVGAARQSLRSLLRDQIRVRWLAPDGHVVQDEKAERPRKPYVASSLAFDAPGRARRPAPGPSRRASTTT